MIDPKAVTPLLKGIHALHEYIRTNGCTDEDRNCIMNVVGYYTNDHYYFQSGLSAIIDRALNQREAAMLAPISEPAHDEH